MHPLLYRLYDPAKGKMKVAALMSGTGSNICRVIDHSLELEEKEGSSPYKVVIIFGDNNKSKAQEIGNNYDLPAIEIDRKEIYQRLKGKMLWKKRRLIFDHLTRISLQPYHPDCLVYGGYTSVVGDPLLNYLGINVHPSHKYKGLGAVKKAILNKDPEIKSIVHLVEKEVDAGKKLMLSSALEISLEEGFGFSDSLSVDQLAGELQEKIKIKGDHVILPKTVEFLACGFYQQDDLGNIYFKGMPIPDGLQCDE